MTYWISDILAVALGWLIFNILRFFSLPGEMGHDILRWLVYPQVILGQLLVPLLMTGIFALEGMYGRRSLMSRTKGEILLQTVLSAFWGMMIVFFVAMINDGIHERMLNYELMGLLWLSLATPVLIVRYVEYYFLQRAQKSGKVNIETLLIGTEEECKAMSELLRRQHNLMGLRPVASVGYDGIRQALDRSDIKAVVVCANELTPELYAKIMTDVYPGDMPVFILAENYRNLTLRPKFLSLTADSLLDATIPTSSSLVANCKRVSDIILSATALVVLSPVLGVIAIAVKKSSEGPIVYRQTRLGLHKKEFTIYKFRSMYVGSEADGQPRLAQNQDPRITPLGAVLRKYRLDELLQFWNVLKGDMSLVGPRPERPYFVEKLTLHSPTYTLMHQVRPGLTSLGSVKFGYASNLDEMYARMEFDIIYIQNISFSMDVKVLLYTVRTILAGKGL